MNLIFMSINVWVREDKKKGGVFVMNNVIMTTKNTNTARRNTGIVSSVLTVLIGIFAIAFYCYASEYTYSDSIIFLLLLGLFLIGDGIIMTAIHCINGSTYVDVYKDRFVGKGMQNLNSLNFNVKIEEISNISVQGFWIHIHANGGIYKVMTDKKTATEIFNYYIELKG